ncbi:MAG: LysR family transcriptional regulator [Lautropia sp.]
MELAWLEDFLAVAKLRNFSKAAQTRNTTQPALSRRIKALEGWYGVALIDRSTYPVALTEAGVRFVRVSEHLVSELYRSRREARAEVGAAGRDIRFAMPHSLAINFFPNWWRKERGSSDLTAKVVAADLADCVKLLLNGACQFLLHYNDNETPHGLENVNIRSRRIGRERLVPVCRADDRGRPLFDLDPRSAKGPIPLLTYTSDAYLGQVTARVHARLESELSLFLRYENSLVEALKAEVVLGEGIAWLPEASVAREIGSKALRIVGDPSLIVSLDIWLCCPATAVVPVLAQGLLREPQAGAS